MFNTNMEGPKSKVQDYPTFEGIKPIIKLYLDKGKQYLECSTIMVTPNMPHPKSTIEILQDTFHHININPLFDEPPSLNVNKALSKYPKRTLRLDFK